MGEAAIAEPVSGADFDGTYKLLGELKSGSRSVVYRAEQQKLGKDVAIKVLRARLPEDAHTREHWNDAVRALAALDHPNLVSIAGFGIVGDAPYIAMELLEGETLAERQTRGALPLELAEQLMLNLLRALAYLHVRGVVHGNLSPGAIFLQDEADGDVRLKLIDYAQAQLPGGPDAPPNPAFDPAIYYSPEQAAGQDVDARSDVYSAGSIILQMLAGGSLANAAEEQASGRTLLAPKPVAEATEPFHAFISKALELPRSERFGNADQMLRALLELHTPWFEQAFEPAELGVQPHVALDEPAAPPAEQVLEGEPVPRESPTPPALPIRRRRAPRKKLLAAAALAVLVGGGALAAQRWYAQRAEQPAKPTPPPTAAEAESEAAQEAEQPQEAVAPAPQPNAAPAATPPQASAAPPDAPPTAAAVAAPSTVQAPPTTTADAGRMQGAKFAIIPELLANDPRAPAPAPATAPDQPGPPVQPSPSDTAAPAQPSPSNAATRAQPAVPAGPNDTSPPGQSAAADNAPRVPPSAAPSVDEPTPAANPQPGLSGAPEARAAAPKHAEPNPKQRGTTAEPTKPADAEQAAAPPGETATEASAPALQPIAAAKKVDGSVRHVRPTPSDIQELLALTRTKDKPRGVARDPWAGELPKELALLREAIAKGERGTPHQVSVLREFCRELPDDAHGHLLLAGLYSNRGWSADALDQYDLAYQKDPSSRGAPEMLADTLHMVTADIAQADAARFIARRYQREALPAIDKLLRDKALDKPALARLKQLRARIASGAR